MFAALHLLSRENPRFRAWSRYRLAGLVQKDLLPDIVEVLTGPDVEFGLRLLVLQALEGSALVSELSEILTAMVVDPAAAFANIASAIKPRGRFAFMVWQGRDRNEWATAIHEALNPDATEPVVAGKAFSLSERTATAGLLEMAGFAEIEFSEVNEPVFYGPNPETALATIASFDNVAKALSRPAAAEIRARLLDMLRKHQTQHGIQFASRAWLITGRKADDRQWASKVT